MHVLAASAILAGTHKLVVDTSCASPSCVSFWTFAMVSFPFFGNHGHPVEVVLSKVEILSGFNLHILALVVVKR